MPGRSAGRGRSDRGGTAVELAILWPVVVLVVFGGVQITTYFTARTVALSAAQVGVTTERRYDAVPGAGQLGPSSSWTVPGTGWSRRRWTSRSAPTRRSS